MNSVVIQSVIHHSDAIKSFIIEKPFSIEPGQFVMLWIPGEEEKPFSISKIGSDFLEISVQTVGEFTKKINSLNEGDRISIRGPYGNSFEVAQNERALLVGGDMCKTQVRGLAHYMLENKIEFKALFGGRFKEQLIFVEDTYSGKVTYVTNDGSYGKAGMISDHFVSLINEFKPTAIYCCGPEGMMQYVANVADEFNIKSFFALEKVMKCGVGVCGSCCLHDGRRICKEGPIFNSSALKELL